MLALAGFAAGTLVFQFEAWPYDPLSRAYASASRRARPAERVLRTKFVDLEVRHAQYGHPRDGAANGGFAVVGDTLLLMVDGTLSLLDPETLRQTPLDVAFPDNGHVALEARPQPHGRPLHLKNRWHRYIDLLAHGGALYLSYSNYRPEEECVTSVVARLPLRGPLAALRARPDDWETVAETQPCLGFLPGPKPYSGHKAGGRLAVAKDGALLWTVGDYGYDGIYSDPLPQDPGADYGRVWRIDPATGRRSMLTVGHRNPQGLAVAPDGRIWATEHGPEGGDELNALVAGTDYGWPSATYGTQYGERTWPGARRPGRHDGYRQPAWAWVPSIGVSALDVAERLHPAWDGDLLVGSLKAQSLFRVSTDGDRAVSYERIALGDRIKDVLVYQGRVFLFTADGDVVRLTPRADAAQASAPLAELSAQAAGEVARCLTCHGRGGLGGAPDLCGVRGRRPGTVGEASDALAARGGTWSDRRLRQFLRDAQAAVPGTTMPDPAIEDPAVRAEIVDHLDVFCE